MIESRTQRVTYYAPSGEITGNGEMFLSEIAAMKGNADALFIVGEFGSATHYIAKGRAVKKPACPSALHVFDYESRKWVLDTTRGTALTHARRAEAYPGVGEQLDALWHAMDRGELPVVPSFYDPIKAVKVKFPKTVK